VPYELQHTRWFKYDRDYLCVNKSQFVPVIFEPPCNSRICIQTVRNSKTCDASGLNVILSVFQELSKSLESSTGKLYAVKCDVRKESDIKATFKWVKDNFGGVDILINNAALSLDSSLIGTLRRQSVLLMVWTGNLTSSMFPLRTWPNCSPGPSVGLRPC
jgi:hypothetical protein